MTVREEEELVWERSRRNERATHFIWTAMQPATVKAKIHVPALHSWLLPANVNLSATPKPLTAMTETDPTSEQIEM